MAIPTPRVPNDPIGETHSWREFFYRLTTYVAQTSGSFFTGLNFTGSNLASIVTRNHNDLTQIQGGVIGDRHHLTTAQVGRLPLTGQVVGSLPTGTVGQRSWATDALAPTFGAIVVGGGAVTIPVFFNGTGWIVG